MSSPPRPGEGPIKRAIRRARARQIEILRLQAQLQAEQAETARIHSEIAALESATAGRSVDVPFLPFTERRPSKIDLSVIGTGTAPAEFNIFTVAAARQIDPRLFHTIAAQDFKSDVEFRRKFRADLEAQGFSPRQIDTAFEMFGVSGGTFGRKRIQRKRKKVKTKRKSKRTKRTPKKLKG